MKLLIVSTAPLIYRDNSVFAYSPYVNELIILEKFADEITFACPVWPTDRGLLITKIPFHFVKHYEVIDSNLNSVKNIFKALFQSIYNFAVLLKAMKNADHIHLRCPGNIALIGCIAQIFFPKKIKTAKYAGNWDPNSQQPWAYKLQKRILNNTFLTKNMQVLVYGNWQNQSKNIKSFFTATYSESEKETFQKTGFENGIQFIFVGSLVTGKDPLYAVKLIEELTKKGEKVVLNLYGEGTEKKTLEHYIKENQLENNVFLHGNQDKETIKKAYQTSHFAVLPSKSEGWPKAIAEAMFWGCVPVATKVSCVPFMLDYGKRGILIEMNLEKDISQIKEILEDENNFLVKSQLAAEWSQKYTKDFFEAEIKKLLVR
ncbi:glycosyltransferase involved in cell wall biosynthesis [Flavobacterium chryseum]|uniref:glycosyltransferase n=1 Tax=Flavobacterium sp. P3160 TaxID=2512113 RepID=UPI00105E9479|nr:glycosyltransferase [Flavobacterium sp. P3160]TDO77482.1 glycosyltransferase involved in cell wall biosynthesis [Flavobacterium sp. P3160]